jgi:large subunit ribosomal protein L18
MSKDKNKKIARRKFRVRSALTCKVPRARVSVFKSLRHIYAQVIDDATQKTVASSSSADVVNASGDKTEMAKAVGLQLAAKIKKLALKDFVFDRGSFLYHGRVKALAEGLREGGVAI